MGETRHAILRIVWGAQAFRSRVLAPGDVVRVGRTKESDFVVPGDKTLSDIHFEIDWDGARCEIRDRRGRGGTLLDGVAVRQAWPNNGSWIKAGETSFSIHFEAHTPPRELPPDEAARRARVAEARAALAAEPALWGILDAARDERVLVLLRESIDDHRSLYEGPQGHALAQVAPYLVRFVPGSRLLRALLDEGWGAAWGIFAACDAPLKDVRRHFRRLLVVEEEPKGKRLYFRFYDPRVLRDFLPLATPRQASELFGDLQCFLFEGEDLALVRAEPPDFAERAARGG